MFLGKDAKGPIRNSYFQHTHSTCISQGDGEKPYKAEASDCHAVQSWKFLLNLINIAVNPPGCGDDAVFSVMSSSNCSSLRKTPSLGKRGDWWQVVILLLEAERA